MYLPSTFIHHNLKSPEILPKDDPTIAPSALNYVSLLKEAKWLKTSGWFYTIDWPEYPNKTLVTEIKRGDKLIAWYGVNIDNKLGIADKSCKHTNKEYTLPHFEHRLWGPMYYFVPIPKDMQPGDKINCYVWNPNKQDVLVDNISLEIYK